MMQPFLAGKQIRSIGSSFLVRQALKACSHSRTDINVMQDEDRISSSLSASTSQPKSEESMLSRWQQMQQALKRSQTVNTVSNPAKAWQTGHGLDQFITRPEKKASASNAGEESAVLDWREALQEAQRFESEQTSREVLTDTFGRKHTYLRISLTEKCNLRCLYCMPEEGVDLTPGSHLLSSEEIVHLVRLFAKSGVNKIRLTGGEPTLRRDLVQLTGDIGRISGIQQIGITTNGIVLKKHLKDLQANGLSLLNLSLDTLREDRFEKMTRRQGLRRVLDSIDHALDLGFHPLKVNVVLMRGVNDDEICDFVEMTRDRPINVRFIEYMPFDGNIWERQKMISYREMMTQVTRTFGHELQPLEDPKGEVAKNFRVPHFVGSVSFVTSMTTPFCSDCNRLRLMADGNLKVCLFGANEVSMRDALRGGASESQLLSIISLAVDRKKAAHAGMYELSKTKNRAMVRIGG